MGERGAKPLAGKRVVVTRSVEQSYGLADALRDAGAEPVLLPLIAITPPEDFAELDACLQAAGKFDWVLFTSQNAVRALEERCTTLGPTLPQIFSATKIAAVGPATAEATRNAGLPVAYVSKRHIGVSLADELAEEVAGKQVFVPRSDKANPELIEVLKRHNAKVTAVVAYKTVAAASDSQRIAQTLWRQAADAILFFSPSAVHLLGEVLGTERFRDLSNQCLFVAIGPVSEKAFEAEGIRRFLVAGDTTITASIAVLAEFFNNARLNRPAGAKHG